MGNPRNNTTNRFNMSNTKDNKVLVSFSAIDPWLERNIVSPAETPVHGKDYVQWGDNNSYPDYLLELVKTVPTLRSIIQGTVDFIVGDDATILPLVEGYAPGQMNLRGDTIAEQVEDLARDWMTYGGMALQVIRAFDGSVAEVYYIDIRFLRMNKEGDVFYYSEKWAERGRRDAIVYPAFRADIAEKWAGMSDEERDRNASSILYVKSTHSQVYPLPVYAASVKACEIERLVDDYHLSSIMNGFASSLIVNFNNGQPTDEMKECRAGDVLLEQVEGQRHDLRGPARDGFRGEVQGPGRELPRENLHRVPGLPEPFRPLHRDWVQHRGVRPGVQTLQPYRRPSRAEDDSRRIRPHLRPARCPEYRPVLAGRAERANRELIWQKSSFVPRPS